MRRFGRNRQPSNDYIVVIRVGGKMVATVVWDEKKTMYCGDEESIELHKVRELEFEVYHTDNRSLCATGSMPLGSLLNEEDCLGRNSFATFSHRTVAMRPEGTLHCQTSYSDPEQFMERVLEGDIECKRHVSATLPAPATCATSWRNSISFRKSLDRLNVFPDGFPIFFRSGTVLATNTRQRYHPRARLNNLNITQSVVQSHDLRVVDCLNNYRLMDVLGIGSFGTVQLSQRIRDSKYCAIKMIEKDPRSARFDTAELHILKNLRHPFICSLLSSFIANDVLYLILEFCDGGDLHTHLSRTANGFTKTQVTFFATCIVLAVEYLHEKLYVHRDLKTENIMLTREGHLKIIDFGLCRKLKYRGEKLNDIVGTTTHLAAEIHRREPYGIEMDWWAVGVSLYQLRTREQPFYGTREAEMERNSKITKWPEFHDLLIGLLAKHPKARLGYYSSDDVKKHPFFMDTNFNDVLQVRPPYIPFLRPGIDLEFFDNQYHSELNTSSSSYSSISSTTTADLLPQQI